MSRSFILLISGYFITSLGVNIGYTGQLLNAYSLTKTVMGVSVFLFVKMIATLLINPIIFKIIDKWSKKKILIFCQIINILVSSLLIMFETNYYMFILLGIIISIGNSFFTPAFRGIVPCVVKKENISKANFYISISENFLSLVGFSLAGVLSFNFGYSLTFLIDALTSVLAVFLLFGIKETLSQIKKDISEKEISYFSFYKKINKELIFINYNFFFWTLGGFLSSSEIPFFKKILSLNENLIGIVLSFSALGGIIVSKLFSSGKYSKKKLNKLYTIGFLGLFLVPILYSYMNEKLFFMLLLVSLFGGVSTVLLKMSSSIYINTYYNLDEQGKVFSFLHMINHTGMGMGIILSGILEKYFKLNILYKIYPIVIIIIAILSKIVSSKLIKTNTINNKIQKN